MIRYADVFFMSDEKTGHIHPAGDGLRRLVVMDTADGVMTLYPPDLSAKAFKTLAWNLLRPNSIPIEGEAGTRSLLERLGKAKEGLQRLGLPYDREETEQALTALLATLAPAPRIRTRSAGV